MNKTKKRVYRDYRISSRDSVDSTLRNVLIFGSLTWSTHTARRQQEQLGTVTFFMLCRSSKSRCLFEPFKYLVPGSGFSWDQASRLRMDPSQRECTGAAWDAALRRLPPREHALSVFMSAVQRVAPESLVADALVVEDGGKAVVVAGKRAVLGNGGIRMLAFGKASLLMAK